jgi:8-oxo-dGTP diphosphatase
MLYLVRHAKAGNRHEFTGNDRLRPLSASGKLQARALADALVADGVQSLISSPYLRCIQTLYPAAKRIGAKVATDELLSEGRSPIEVLKLLESLPDGAAACSHGDVIPATIAALERRGCKLTSAPDWRKATVWVLDRGDDGEISTASVWPPPVISS